MDAAQVKITYELRPALTGAFETKLRSGALGWEHINLTGDYVWKQSRRIERGKYRPLRPFSIP